MRVFVQRCLRATCFINQQPKSKIDQGLVLLVAFTEGDTKETVLEMVHKILHLRIFPDEKGVMNVSILDTKGKILSISQFTLYADTRKGNRPSYKKAMSGTKAILLYDFFNHCLEEQVEVATGLFGADMQIELVNDGPTSLLLEK